MTDPFAELEKSVNAALETYSNVHRGSGHNSVVSTRLYDKARDIVLEYLELSKAKYAVIFCTPERASVLTTLLKPGSYHSVSSNDYYLPLGIIALAAKKKSLPKGAPFQSGGGTTRLVSSDWILWADTPGRFEAGTPAIINVIAFARALQLSKLFGNEAFNKKSAPESSAREILYSDKLDKYKGLELLYELRKTHIGRGILVPTVDGLRPYINLDNAASTPTFIPVWETVCKVWRQPATVQHEIIEEVRSICAKVVGAPTETYDIIFTSNTTEAINLAAESMEAEHGQAIEPVILNTIMEHNSNDLPWRLVPGYSLIRMEANAEGFVDMNELERLLSEYNRKYLHGKKHIRLVAISGASNVLGAFNNLEEVSRIAHRYGARMLVDAAQVVAHRKIDMERYGIDYLAFSAHKTYAPFGTGVLVIRKGLLNLTHDRMEIVRTSGEENVAGIAALGKALLLLQRIGMNIIEEEEKSLTARMLYNLAKIDGLTVYGIKDPDSPAFKHKGGVIIVNMKGIMANKLARLLADHGGIGTRNGCFCAHILVKRLVNISPGLEKFQRMMVTILPMIKLPGLLRISLGIENSGEDIDALICALNKITRQPYMPDKINLKQQMRDFICTIEQRVYE